MRACSSNWNAWMKEKHEWKWNSALSSFCWGGKNFKHLLSHLREPDITLKHVSLSKNTKYLTLTRTCVTELRNVCYDDIGACSGSWRTRGPSFHCIVSVMLALITFGRRYVKCIFYFSWIVNRTRPGVLEESHVYEHWKTYLSKP